MISTFLLCGLESSRWTALEIWHTSEDDDVTLCFIVVDNFAGLLPSVLYSGRASPLALSIKLSRGDQCSLSALYVLIAL